MTCSPPADDMSGSAVSAFIRPRTFLISATSPVGERHAHAIYTQSHYPSGTQHITGMLWVSHGKVGPMLSLPLVMVVHRSRVGWCESGGGRGSDRVPVHPAAPPARRQDEGHRPERPPTSPDENQLQSPNL